MLGALLLLRRKREKRHFCQELDVVLTAEWSHERYEWSEVSQSENLVVIFGRHSPSIIGLWQKILFNLLGYLGLSFYPVYLGGTPRSYLH